MKHPEIDYQEENRFGQRLRELREARRLSKNELAKRAGIDATFLGRVEKGVYSPPRPGTIQRICTGLSASSDQILELFRLADRPLVQGLTFLEDDASGTIRVTLSDEQLDALAAKVVAYLDARLGQIVHRQTMPPATGDPDATDDCCRGR